ncbi:hypothetical protein [Leptolyngbya sp. O-77]|uniref:hypothetical protein n=1 Tax=Leptolyngbya sp. O-77 TaxID=1080068 RepID=UPI00083800AE|nr:hypothetical protein [Leptolyngbya sp. O-77]
MRLLLVQRLQQCQSDCQPEASQIASPIKATHAVLEDSSPLDGWVQNWVQTRSQTKSAIALSMKHPLSRHQNSPRKPLQAFTRKMPRANITHRRARKALAL